MQLEALIYAMNSSDNAMVVVSCLHPNKVYQFGSPESYYFINIPLIVVNLVLLVFIVLGNTAVILAYFRDPTLQSVPNMLLITLAFTDLFVGLVAQPLFIAILVRDVLGAEPLCWLALLSSVTLKFCGGASLLTLSLIISLERYLAICYPFKHLRWVTKAKIKRTVAILWSFLLTLSGSLLLGMRYKAYFLILALLTFTAIAVTTFACCGILMKIRPRRRRNVSDVNVNDNGRIRSHYNTHNAASTVSTEIEKRDYKIVVTTFYIIGAVVVCYTPMFVAVVYAQIKSLDKLYLKYFYPVVMTLVALNSLLNPAIYCLRNRKFTNAIRKIGGIAASNENSISATHCFTIELEHSGYRKV